MLTCPICNQPVSEREMQEGRCPECMGLLSWQGFETDSSAEPYLEEFPAATDSVQAEPAAKPGEVNEVSAAAPPAAEAGAEEHDEVIERQNETTYSPDPSEGPPPSVVAPVHHDPLLSEDPLPYVPDDPASLEDTSSDVSKGDQDERGHLGSFAGNRSLGLEQTLQSHLHRSLGEDQDIAKTIAPRDLSAEELKAIDGQWNTHTEHFDDIQASIDPRSTLPGSKSSLVVKARAVGAVHESHGDGNDYQMMEALGQGGVGIVYSARQASIDRNVALKMLHPRLAQNQEYRNKFLAEAVVIGDLDHPQIVPIYDLGKTGSDELFYTMKRVEGTPWSAKIDKFSLEDNLEVLLKICDAIAFAHYRGVIHRDLKPDNVMLGDFGEVLVMDWGLALLTEDSSKRATIEDSGGLGGTPAYMAPEMVSGPVEKITDRSDIYLLGALLFRILTGKTPHHGKNVKECVRAAAQNLLQPTEVRGELIEIALKAMATDPDDRYFSALEFRDALKSYEAHAESLKLTTKAEQDLTKAQRSGDYQLFARSVFGFEEAIALWRANSDAHKGQLRSQEEYARAALSNGDFDLGLSVLNRDEPSHLLLVRKLEAGQADRDSRQRQLQTTRTIFRWATFSFVLMLSLACVVIYTKMKAAETAKQTADAATIKANTSAAEALEANTNLLNKNKELDEQTKRAEQARIAAEESEKIAKENRKLADENRQEAEQSRKVAEAQTYLAQIALAAKKIEENRFDEAREILSAYRGTPLVGWEWGHLWELCNLAAADVKLTTALQDVSNSPNGTFFAVAGDDGQVRIWKTENFRKLEDPQPAVIWKAPATEGSLLSITSVEFSPDGELLAVGDSQGVVSLLKVSANAEIERVAGLKIAEDLQAPISCLRYSYSDDRTDSNNPTRWLLVGSESGHAAVWDLNAGAWVQFPRGSTLRGHRAPVRGIAASPDRRFLLTAGEDDKIQIWKNSSPDLNQPVSTSLAPGASAVVEPYEIWKTVYWMHAGAVLSLDTALDDQGKLLIVSGGQDGSVQIWNVDDVPSYNMTTVPPRTTVIPPTNNAAVLDVRFVRRKSGSGDKFELRLLTCGDDRTVQLWGVNSRNLFEYRTAAPSVVNDQTRAAATLIHRFRGHGSRVNACDLIPGFAAQDPSEAARSLIVSVGDDQRVMLWDPEGYSEAEIFELESEAQVLDATFDHGSDLIASVTSKGVLSLTDLISKQSTLVTEHDLNSESWKEGHDYLANQGRFIPAAPGEKERWFVSAGIDGKVIVWDLDRGVSIREYDQSGRTSLIAISPDRKWIVTGGPGTSALLGRLPRSIVDPSDTTSDTTMIRLTGHKDVVTAAGFSSDGRWILTGDKQGELHIWRRDSDSNSQVQVQSVFNTRAHSEEITEVLTRGDSIITTSRDYSIKIWKITESGDPQQVSLTLERRLRGTGEISEASVSPQGQFLACVRRKYEEKSDQGASSPSAPAQLSMISEITVYDLNSDPPQEWTQSKRDSLILTTDFFHGQPWLLLTENDGRVWLWDWATGQEHLLKFDAELENYCTRVDADGARLVTTGGRQVQLWEFDPKQKQATAQQATLESERLLGPHYRISSVSFSFDDSWIVTGDLNGYVKLWKRNSEGRGYTLQYRLPSRSSRSIVAARFSPDSPRTLLTAWEDLLILWTYDGENWVEQKKQKTISDETLISYADFSPSGTKLLIGRQDGTCEVWNAAELTREKLLEGQLQHQQSIVCGAFSNDERLIVTGSDDKNTRGILWRLDQGSGKWSAVANITGHSGGITSVAFSPIHQLRLLTGSRDATAKLWDISNWTAAGSTLSSEETGDNSIKELLTLRGHGKEVTAVDFDHTGQYLLTSSRDGKTIRWSSAPIDPALDARRDSLELRPGESVRFGVLFEILDPVSPELPGGMLSLSAGSQSETTATEAKLSISLESGRFRLQKSVNGEQTEVILSSASADDPERKIGTLTRGAVSEPALELPLELSIEPGTTHLELMDFLNQLSAAAVVPDDETGTIELVVRLSLNLPHSTEGAAQSTSVILQIILPEPEASGAEAIDQE